ncbi:MAG: hypothetical protein ACUVT1_14430, partial [Anaerolineae bacterium]
VYVDDVTFQICAPAPQVPTPTFTPLPPPPTPWTPYPTPAGQCTELVVNGGFEAGTQGWYLGPTERVPALVSDNRHSGSYAMSLGIPSGPNVESFSSIRQTVQIPADAANVEITFWVYLMSTETGGRDHQEFVVLSPADNTTLALPWRVWYDNSRTWMQQRIDLSNFRGQSIVVYFNAYNDGAAGVTSMVIDDISLLACRPVLTPTATAIALVVPTATFTVPPAGAAGQQTPAVTMARATPTPQPTSPGPLGAGSKGTIIAAAAVITAILGSVFFVGLVLRHRRRQAPSGQTGGVYGAGPVAPPPGFGPTPAEGAQPMTWTPPSPPPAPGPEEPGEPSAPAGGAPPAGGMSAPRPMRVVSSTTRLRRISSVDADVSPRLPPEEEPGEPIGPEEGELAGEGRMDSGAPRRWIQLADKEASPEQPPGPPAEDEEEDEDLPPW